MRKYKKRSIVLILLFLIISDVLAQEIEGSAKGKRFFEVGFINRDDDIDCVSNVCSGLPDETSPSFYYGIYFKGLASPVKNSANVYFYYEFKRIFTKVYMLGETEVQNIHTNTVFGIRGYY